MAVDVCVVGGALAEFVGINDDMTVGCRSIVGPSAVGSSAAVGCKLLVGLSDDDEPSAVAVAAVGATAAVSTRVDARMLFAAVGPAAAEGATVSSAGALSKATMRRISRSCLLSLARGPPPLPPTAAAAAAAAAAAPAAAAAAAPAAAAPGAVGFARGVDAAAAGFVLFTVMVGLEYAGGKSQLPRGECDGTTTAGFGAFCAVTCT